jgi:mannan endo-1,4-beta-mannosidase
MTGCAGSSTASEQTTQTQQEGTTEEQMTTQTTTQEETVTDTTQVEDNIQDESLTETETTAQAVYEAKYALSNPDADAVTSKVYDYICENFGTTILSCQQESTWMGSPDYEMNYIEETTGKLPAMRGLDFMNGDFSGVVERALAWWQQGGLVTICWHTGIEGKGYTEALNDEPDFDKLLTEGTAEHDAMIANWDKAAEALTVLRDAGVPVLWRPFHEFDGQWFWWGKGGSDNFVKLWQMMYDYFTDDYGLTNLIWVLGYSGEVKEGWYPGDEYCDIIGSDTYDNSTNSKGWERLEQVTDNKPLAFHECGNVPSAEQFLQDGTMWSWFMIWHTDYITGNDQENLKAVYNSDLVITLDELPEF